MSDVQAAAGMRQPPNLGDAAVRRRLGPAGLTAFATS